jgi:maltooligosyltrehalose trehalohydrolase
MPVKAPQLCVRVTLLHVGADYSDGTCRFSVWAPNHNHVTVSLTAENQHFPMDKFVAGYWTHTAEGFEPGTAYMFELDGKETKPDPASHYQPDGVFGPSQVIDHDTFRWKDRGWRGLDIKDLVFYEVHVGTFTPEGTFKAASERIKELQEFGINAIELMPITQFSGKRNWGYDGVFPFAVQNSYGAPDALKALVNECHTRGVALFLDFVYNHLGPEGNCLNDYAPYFPNSNMGRWGANVNLDGPLNDGVRNYFIENTLHWLNHYHIDGIRLDAVLSMQDSSSRHFLTELKESVRSFGENSGRKVHLIAESGYNVPAVLQTTEKGGYGFDAQWLDDFQHAVFALITGEREGYYRDYGSIQDLTETLTEGYVYVGNEHDYKRRSPNESYSWIPADKLIVFAQNHDQVGNRLLGDRVTSISGFEAAKLAAGIVLLSPYVPLLFMGEEYGETAPFLFFADYQSKELTEAVRVGRGKEFAHFHWKGHVPDPKSIDTFERSKLDWQQRYAGRGQKIAAYYRTLIELRKNHLIFQAGVNRQIKHVTNQENILFIHKQNGEAEVGIVANLSKEAASYSFHFEDGVYVKILDSADFAWDGPGPTLPTLAIKGDDHQIGGFNIAVFLKESKEGKPLG